MPFQLIRLRLDLQPELKAVNEETNKEIMIVSEVAPTGSSATVNHLVFSLCCRQGGQENPCTSCVEEPPLRKRYDFIPV